MRRDPFDDGGCPAYRQRVYIQAPGLRGWYRRAKPWEVFAAAIVAAFLLPATFAVTAFLLVWAFDR